MNMRRTRTRSLPESISITELKTRGLELVDTVASTGASVTVTKHGRPVARRAPVRNAGRPGLGLMKGRIRILGDIVAPLDEVWGADT
jgi:prevent-host-death family protein